MKYLHLYNKQTDYDNVKNKLILPSASLIEKNNHVEYNPHQYVEINGVKWATMNVGAKSITDYGLYFQWGDTQGYTSGQTGTGEGKKKFASDYSDYKWYDKENSTSDTPRFTKYNKTDMTLESVDDAVNKAWGGSWRMPTKIEIDTLLNSTAVTKTWKTDYNGTNVAGYEFHDKNSNDTLFFPACGYAFDGSMYVVGSDGGYWSGSLSSSDVFGAYGLYFDNGGVYWQYYLGRCDGFTVRGVLAEN